VRNDKAQYRSCASSGKILQCYKQENESNIIEMTLESQIIFVQTDIYQVFACGGLVIVITNQEKEWQGHSQFTGENTDT
jgi:hypothetical protein